MKNNVLKSNYIQPIVKTVSFKVEAGFQATQVKFGDPTSQETGTQQFENQQDGWSVNWQS